MEINIAPEHAAFLDKIANLEQVILNAHPNLPVLLRDIHKQLAADPVIVTILSEEQIGIIVSGLKRQTKTELITASIKKTGTKALKNVSLDDF